MLRKVVSKATPNKKETRSVAGFNIMLYSQFHLMLYVDYIYFQKLIKLVYNEMAFRKIFLIAIFCINANGLLG